MRAHIFHRIWYGYAYVYIYIICFGHKQKHTILARTHTHIYILYIIYIYTCIHTWIMYIYIYSIFVYRVCICFGPSRTPNLRSVETHPAAALSKSWWQEVHERRWVQEGVDLGRFWPCWFLVGLGLANYMGFIFGHKWDANLRVSTITLEGADVQYSWGLLSYLTVSIRSRISWLSSAKWAKPCWVGHSSPQDWISWRCRFSRQPKYHQCCCWIN